jgi:hypothetical protein
MFARIRSFTTLPKESAFMGLSGGQIFHEMMLRHDVKVVFGYPGGAILPVYDAIYESNYFDFVLPRVGLKILINSMNRVLGIWLKVMLE